MPATSRPDNALPTGTVTFMFTDIEGSTALWEGDSDGMKIALARHDALLRNAIESSGGQIFKTTGDGVVAAFGEAPNALAACLAAQRALQARCANSEDQAHAGSAEARPPVSIRVRMGLHSGVAELRNGDYFGTSLNRAARIMSAAHGEQILLSSATAELLREHLSDGVGLRDMGEHRLKGLLNAERLLQIDAPDLRSEFPPLASLTGHSLPVERDAFVGRRDALAELERRFDAGARLVSVLGLGGTGKTRLVTRFGWDALGDYAGGVWFCDLAQARSPDGIVHAVAHGLDVTLGKDDPVTQIGQAIAGRRRCLVILDNFEQVARHAEDTLGKWLDRAADARFIVTTREVLGLPGEEVLALAPLAASDATALFVRRAETAKPGFRPTVEDQSSIASLMKLLEGMPLAIELAAARVRVMPPRMLLQRMSERFKLLSSTGGRVDRQATLRAVFDWSWDLLSLPEKAALAQLSVFEGGFTLESVEAVLDLSAYDNAPWPVDALQSLVHKSLVRPVIDERFDLLVSVQEYAAEHLRTDSRYAGSGPAALRAAQARHGVYFAGLDELAAMADAGAEIDNLVVACRRAAARGDAAVATCALEGAWSALRSRGPFKAGADLVALVRAIPGLDAAARARAALVAARVVDALGKEVAAYAEFQESLTRAREVGDQHTECCALIGVSFRDRHAGRLELARAHGDAALVLARELGDDALQSDAHNNFGNLEVSLGRRREAAPHYEIALVLARAARDTHRECAVLGNIANLSNKLGDTAGSRSYGEASLAAARKAGNRRVESNTLCNLGLLHLLHGRFDEARDNLETALAVARDLGHAHLECIVLCNLGIIYDSLVQFEEAHNHYDTALAVARELGDLLGEGQVLGYLGLLHARQSNFDESRRCLTRSEELLRKVADRESLGIMLCNRAHSEHLAGAAQAAKAVLAEADIIAAEIGAGPGSEFGIGLARVRTLVHGG